MEILLLLGIIAIVFGTIFKVSVGIMKILFSFVGVLIVIILIPVAFAILIPLAFIGLAIGFLKIIF